MSHPTEWSYRIKASSSASPRKGARSAAAWLMRRMADVVDGGISLRIEYSTTPRIGATLAARCIEVGMDHAGTLLGEMAHQQACENAMRELTPGMFEGGDS